MDLPIQTFGQGVDHPLSKRSGVSTKDAAISFIASKSGLDISSISYRTGFAGQVADHVYAHQSYVGYLPVMNRLACVWAAYIRFLCTARY